MPFRCCAEHEKTAAGLMIWLTPTFWRSPELYTNFDWCTSIDLWQKVTGILDLFQIAEMK
jgi:hypothetical protein